MQKFGFFKKVELRDATSKYGFKNQGLFACEKILKDEEIFRCNPATCDYLPFDQIQLSITRDDILRLIKGNPDKKEFMHRYNYMSDDDKFDMPKGWKTETLTDFCMFFNHGCDGNTGFGGIDTYAVVAKRDIEPNEELTYDYQLMDSETTLYDGLHCKCQSHKCRGVLRFDHYRNIDWIKENYKYSSYLIRKRIDELQTKWFSSSCYLKRDKDGELHLTAFKKIVKNELVAIYSNPSSINQESHYLWNNDNPTCYVNKEGEVYAKQNIEPETELTLKFD